MTTNDNMKQGFSEALNTGQPIPMTIDPFGARSALNLLTSQNTNAVQPLPMLTGGSGTPPKELSGDEVQDWIADHITKADTSGEIAILYTTEILRTSDLLYQRVQNIFGGRIVFLRSEPTPQEEATAGAAEEDAAWENRADVVELMATERLRKDILDHQIQQRYEELRAEAVKNKELPKTETK